MHQSRASEYAIKIFEAQQSIPINAGALGNYVNFSHILAITKLSQIELKEGIRFIRAFGFKDWKISFGASTTADRVRIEQDGYFPVSEILFYH